MQVDNPRRGPRAARQLGLTVLPCYRARIPVGVERRSVDAPGFRPP